MHMFRSLAARDARASDRTQNRNSLHFAQSRDVVAGLARFSARHISYQDFNYSQGGLVGVARPGRDGAARRARANDKRAAPLLCLERLERLEDKRVGLCALALVGSLCKHADHGLGP